MGEDTRTGAGRWESWLARLLQAQMFVRGGGVSDVAPADEDTWPARLIRAGVGLAGVGGLVLASWLRRRL